jgi:predicted RNA polymerase sigma factor
MRDPEEFDAFYKDARDRLLVQTFALTGDVRASRSAVRDTFVVAWHHWRKVSRDGDPESGTPPAAGTGSAASSRRSPRPWRRWGS